MEKLKGSGLSPFKNKNKLWGLSVNWTEKFFSDEWSTSSPPLKMSVRSLRMENKPLTNRWLSKSTDRTIWTKRLPTKRGRRDKWDKNSMILPIGILSSWIQTPFFRGSLESLKLLNQKYCCQKIWLRRLLWQRQKSFSRRNNGWKNQDLILTSYKKTEHCVKGVKKLF